MKRSFLTSALVLALAAAMPACGGGGSGEGPQDPSKAGSEESSGDPIASLKATSDGLQKEVDDLLAPLKNAQAVIDSVKSLPADLKAAKGKVDQAKVKAEIKKVVEGGEAHIEFITDADTKAKVQKRIDDVKALVASINAFPEKSKALPEKLAEAVKKIATDVPAAVAKLGVKAKAPFGVSAEDKKKAEADIQTLTEMGKSWPTKIEGWKKDITDFGTKGPQLIASLKDALK
jgi:hypothetical protein